jgi:hypothetical protein
VKPTTLDQRRIRELVELAGEQLEGDWVLVGGALAALWFTPGRVTEDVDIVSVVDRPDRRYALLDFAIAAGLSAEVVNSAADFFLRRIAGWEDHLEVLHIGSRARILRPTPTLFLMLKVGRMSEADLDDCLALVAEAKRSLWRIDVARVVAHLDALAPTGSAPAGARRQKLRTALDALRET